MTDATTPIGIHCTPVPDGITDHGTARLSLVLTPDVRPGASLKDLSLENWPSKISEYAKKGQLRICLSGGAAPDREPIVCTFANNDPVLTNSGEANRRWQEIFRPTEDSPNGLDYLYKALWSNTQSEQNTDARANALRQVKAVADFLVAPQADRENLEAQDFLRSSSTRLSNAIRGQSVSIGRLRIALDALNWVPTQYLDAALNGFHDDSHLLSLLALMAAQERRSKNATSSLSFLTAIASAPGQIPNSTLGDTLSDILGGTATDAINWIETVATAFANRPFQQRILSSLQDTVHRHLLEAGLGNHAGDAFGQMKSLRPASTQGDLERRANKRRGDIGNMLSYSLAPIAKSSAAAQLDFLQSRSRRNGTNMMRALFQEAVRQHTQQPAGGTNPPSAAFAEFKTTVSDNFDQFHQHWRNSTRAILANEQDDEARHDEAARRKFFGIRALPTLAKFLRLTVDIEIPVSALDQYDIITAVFVDDTHGNADLQNRLNTAAWTAFDTTKTADGHAVTFRPASFQTHSLGKNAPDLTFAIPIKDGVVDLRGPPNNDPRFMIAILDLPAAIGSMRVKAEQDSGSQRDGTMPETVSSKSSARQSRGLQLIDNLAQANIATNIFTSWHNGDVQPVAGDKKRPNFAEDLAIGYRPYIQRWRFGVAPKADPWRSLVARSIRIEQIAAFVGNSSYRDLQERDHGYVLPAHKIQGGSDGSGGKPTTDGQMFAWMGSSLGLSKEMDGNGSTAHSDGPGPGQDPESDLPLDIEYGFLRDRDALQPALRIGDSYKMGLSPVFPNCGGPTLAEALQAFDTAGVALGNDSNEPIKFGPPRDIPPPVLLMSEAEAKLWQKTENFHMADRGNAENIVRIVLRSATKPADDKDNVKRYLVPPRANFEVAEQSGLFDRVFEATPKGAFNDYEQERTLGGFTSDDPPSSQKSPPPQHERSRSPVLRPAGYAPPKAQYYPDPLARNLKVAFERAGATPAGFPDAVPLKEFWKQGASSATAKPIELLVKRWSDAREGGQIDFGDTTARVNGVKFATSRAVDRLVIEIAPAEEVNLRFWCVPDRADLLRSHAVLSGHFRIAANALIPQVLAARKIEAPKSATPGPAAAKKFPSKNAAGPINADPLTHAVGLVAKGLSAEQLDATAQFSDVANFLPAIHAAFDAVFSALTSIAPENGLNAWLTVKVVHAVEKPLTVPTVPCNASSRDANKLAIQAIRVRQNTTWQEYASDSNSYIQPNDGSAPKLVTPSDPATAFGLLSQDNGATAYFVGQIDIDRASTGEIRVEASWPETDPASAIQVVKAPNGSAANAPKTYKLEPPKMDRVLFSVKVPRDRGLNPEGQIDLTFDETGALRGLNYPFTDTAAREISLRIVATSRFAADFPPTAKKSEPPDPYALGRFEVESRPPIGSKRLEQAQPETYREYKIIVPATAPPPMAVVSRLEWVMPETLTEFDPGRRLSVEKNFYPRLYLGQDWCGTGDLLAVVCAPADLVSKRPYFGEHEAPPVMQPIPLSAEELLNAPRHRNIPAWDFTKDRSYYSVAEDVSRWGADPTITSGALTGTITRERFSGFAATEPNVGLPGNNHTNVSLLLYKPKFDKYTGEFYVDIGIDPGATHTPVVQLVVARYQPHVTKPEFQLSGITRVRPFQIAPKRKVEVLMLDERNITAIVQGIGYTDRLPEIPASVNPPDKYASQTMYPLQNICVVRLKEDNSTMGLQVYNEGGQALSIRRIAPQFDHPELIWIAQFRLPSPRTRYRYGLHFEEVDLHFADEAYEDVQKPDEHLVERLSSFSLTIDLEHGLYSPNGRRNQTSSRD